MRGNDYVLQKIFLMEHCKPLRICGVSIFSTFDVSRLSLAVVIFQPLPTSTKIRISKKLAMIFIEFRNEFQLENFFYIYLTTFDYLAIQTMNLVPMYENLITYETSYAF